MEKTGTKQRKSRCWSCGSLNVIRWGKQSGKHRFRCKNCGLYFIPTKPQLIDRNRFIWFREWIEGKQTFAQLVMRSCYSERTLKRYFYCYLKYQSLVNEKSYAPQTKRYWFTHKSIRKSFIHIKRALPGRVI